MVEISNKTKNWLLNSDPYIKWQIMKDLFDETDNVFDEERLKIATEGWEK